MQKGRRANMKSSDRTENELKHGRKLATEGAEEIWGWGTPAGRKRASRRAALIAEGACLCSGMRVLEVGCGTGNFTERFAKYGAELLAVDLSPDLLEIARARNLPEDEVRFAEQRFEECDVDGPFDAVIGSSVLHHLDLNVAVKRMLKLLKPGGRISFAEPNMLNPQVFMERKFRSMFPNVSPDETAFVRWRMKRVLSSVGFVDLSVVPLDWLHPAVPEKLIRVTSGIGCVLERIPVVREFAGSLYIRARKPKQ